MTQIGEHIIVRDYLRLDAGRFIGAAFAAGLRKTTEELALALGVDFGRAVLLFAVADGRLDALGLGWGFGLAGAAGAAEAAGRRSTGADLWPAAPGGAGAPCAAAASAGVRKPL